MTLREFNLRVQQVIRDGLSAPCWVMAEISEMMINASGHCYLELVEKSPDDEGLVARARGIIWAYTFRMLQPYFETTTGQTLREGLKVLVKAKAEFHELYGYSLNISDIDPGYTLGDLAMQKAETLRRLEKEGVLRMNQETILALVPQKIAVVSSETAAGYQDFIDQLSNNPYGYVFYTRLFPAIMQGKEAEQSIIRALDHIFPFAHIFDAVVLIRGGGARSDLACYNQYWLASHIAQFPLPVLTGIGHERDESVVDIVAHTRLKTPTAVAEFLIDRLAFFDEAIGSLSSRIAGKTRDILRGKRQGLDQFARIMAPLVYRDLDRKKDMLNRAGFRQRTASQALLHKNALSLSELGAVAKHSVRNAFQSRHQQAQKLSWQLSSGYRKWLMTKKFQIEMLNKSLRLTDPANVLRRGFSITMHRGKPLKDACLTAAGDEIETRLFRGKLISTVRIIKKSEDTKKGSGP